MPSSHGWGSTVWISCTPHPDSHRKAIDVPKEEIFCRMGGWNVATVVSTGLSASTSTVPEQTRQVAHECPCEGIPPISPAVSSIAHSPAKHKCTRSLSLCHSQSSSSSSSGLGSRTGCRSRQSSLSSSGSMGSGSRSGSGSGSWDGSPAWSQASRHNGSVHLGAASDRSIEVLSADEVAAGGGKVDVLESANEADVLQGSMSLLNISTTHEKDTRKCKA